MEDSEWAAQLIARSGDEMPGQGGLLYGDSSEFEVHALGHFGQSHAFSALYARNPGDVLEAVFAETSGNLDLRFIEGQGGLEIPGSFAAFRGVALGPNELVIVQALTDNGDFGIWQRLPNQAIERLVSDGSPVAGSGEIFVRAMVGADATGGIALFGSFLVNGDPLRARALFRKSAGFGVRVVVEEGLPVPGLPGISIQELGGATLASSGDLIYAAKLFGPEARWVILAESPAGVHRLVAELSNETPGLRAGSLIDEIVQIAIADDGRIALAFSAVDPGNPTAIAMENSIGKLVVVAYSNGFFSINGGIHTFEDFAIAPVIDSANRLLMLASGIVDQMLLRATIVEVPPSVQVIGKAVRKTKKRRSLLRGRAFDDVGIEKVELRWRNSARWRPARGTTLWRQRVRLRPGRNRFFVKATDVEGFESRRVRVVVRRLR